MLGISPFQTEPLPHVALDVFLTIYEDPADVDRRADPGSRPDLRFRRERPRRGTAQATQGDDRIGPEGADRLDQLRGPRAPAALARGGGEARGHAARGIPGARRR